MKVIYFCTHTVSWYICGLTGEGKLCLPIAGCNVFRRSVLISIMLCLVLSSLAQGVPADSVRGDSFRIRQLILPSALIAVGSFGVENGWFCSVKRNVKSEFQDLRGDCRFRADDYLQYLPVTANVSLGLVGVQSRHTLRERIAATATAYASMGLMVNVTKYAVREKRPDSGARNSFPSGHTATAFMGAELVRQEYGNSYGAGAYAFAAGIAFLRLYNDRHWLNDILTGAGVGILSARIGYWLLPWERQFFGWRKNSAALVAMPAYNPIEKNVEISFSAMF